MSQVSSAPAELASALLWRPLPSPVSIPLLSHGELERMTRRHTDEIGIIVGPAKDTPVSASTTH